MKENKNNNASDRLDEEVEELINQWMSRGERLHDAAPSLLRNAITLFIGHGFTPEGLANVVLMGSLQQQEMLQAVSESLKAEGISRDGFAVHNTDSNWADSREFTNNSV